MPDPLTVRLLAVVGLGDVLDELLDRRLVHFRHRSFPLSPPNPRAARAPWLAVSPNPRFTALRSRRTEGKSRSIISQDESVLASSTTITSHSMSEASADMSAAPRQRITHAPCSAYAGPIHRAMKGPPLPIYGEDDRVQLICALTCVDHVYVFEEQTVDHILATVKPDIHAKGSDYTEETVPERATVLAYGGRIAIVGGAKTHSTRDTVRTIQSLRENQRV